MSTEETEVKETEQVTPATENVETAAPETANAADDADWDDIPEMEEENPTARTDTENTEKTEKTESAETEVEGRKPDEDGDGEEKDPYAFLYEDGAETAETRTDTDEHGRTRTDAGTDGMTRGTGNADLTDGREDQSEDARNTDAGAETLDSLNVDNLISDLPDGELKDFADNYPEETKMAAAMAVQVLKKLGFDKLRGDLVKYTGTAEEYAKNQAAMAAYAAQQEFEKAVLKIHPDANDIINGKDRTNFAGWLKNQPKFIQRRFRDCNDPEEAADILTRYKETRGIQKQAQQSRTAKIRGVKSSAAVAKRGTDADDADWDDVPEPDDF